MVWYLGVGAKLISPKIEFLRICARIAFLAREKFLRQPLVTYKTFEFDRFPRFFFICSKNRDFAFLRAHCVFGARQVFEKTFGHIQNFWQKQIFQNVPLCPKNALVTFGVCPPPLSVLDSFVLAREQKLHI